MIPAPQKTRFSPKLIIFLTILIDSIGYGLIIPLLPFYAESLNVGSTALGILIASFAFMQFLFSPVLGRVSDKIGRKPVLVISLIISIGSLLVFAFATSFLILLFSRILAGLATEGSVAKAYIVDVSDKKDRVSSLGKAGAAHGVGYIIGPAIGGLLSGFGYTVAGLVAVVITLVNLCFVLLFLPESMKDKKGLNLVKSGKSVLGSVSSVFGALKKDSIKNYGKSILDLFKKPGVGIILSISMLVTLSFSTLPVIIPYLGIAFFGFGASEVSYFFIYLGVIQIVLQGLVIGKLAKRFNEIILLIVGPLLMGLGMILMPSIANILVFALAMAVLALSTGIVRTVVPSLITKFTPENQRGSVLGLTTSIESISAVPGSLIGGILFEYGGLAAPFLTNALLLFLSFGLGYLFLRVFIKKNEDQQKH